MRSPRGVAAASVFLLAFPLLFLYQLLFSTGVEAVVHALLALGSVLMALAAFDYRTPSWAPWLGAASAGLLAVIFFLQGVSEVTHHEGLTHLAYAVLGQSLEGRLVDLFMVWCVVVLALDRQLNWRILGTIVMAAVACAKAYSLVLAYNGRSMDTETPILKLLWLLPFVWILLESARKRPAPSA
jgi:hypothetical protein